MTPASVWRCSPSTWKMLDEEIESPSAHQRLHQIWDGIGEIGADLHSLSHRLHSSTLDTLGLVAGAKAFCTEFAEQQEIRVDFADENVPRYVPGDAALCLFRILQEGLRNIKRHSGADQGRSSSGMFRRETASVSCRSRTGV